MQTLHRTKRRTTTLTALALIAGLALLAHAPAHAQGLSGQAVNVTYREPNTGTILFDLGTNTVAAAGTVFPFGDMNALVTPGQIVFTFPVSDIQHVSFATDTFNGFQVAETGVSPANIIGVTLNSAASIPGGFDASRISFTGTTVNANFQGLTFFSENKVTLNLEFGPAPATVPEPSSVASMGLGSAGLLGMVLRARKRRRAA